jgi:hypothetical protein
MIEDIVIDKNIIKKVPSINQIAAVYLPVISKFKARYDVQNGTALGYHKGHNYDEPTLDIEDKPKGIGDGTTTCGYCVSASQALLNDKVFQYLLNERNATAKLVSIDIQRRFYGSCYTGHQNKWHTAIFIQDTGVNLIVDITCSQFGNSYVDKTIWDLNTWLDTFRSPTDQHIIADFDGKLITPVPVPITHMGISPESLRSKVFDRLHDYVSMSDEQRSYLAEFLALKLSTINGKILIGNVTKKDYEYIENINSILKLLDYINYSGTLYSLFRFPTKEASKNWVKLFFENKCICPGYTFFSESLDNACSFIGTYLSAINVELTDDKVERFILLKLVPINLKDGCVAGIKTDDIINYTKLLIPYGIKLGNYTNTKIYNSGLSMEADMVGNHRKTNTTIIEITYNN